MIAGIMTLDRAAKLRRNGHAVRVLLDGNDVTRDCRCADPVRGLVELLRRDATGRAYLCEGGLGVATQIVSGSVVVQVRLWALR